MANLNHSKSRNYTVEQTLRKHLKPKVGDIVLALDYHPGATAMVIGKLIGIGPDDHLFGVFNVQALEWKDDVQPMHWEQAYKIPEGLVTVETND